MVIGKTDHLVSELELMNSALSTFGSVIDLIGTYWDFYAANFATDHVLGKTEAGTQEECQTSMVSSTT